MSDPQVDRLVLQANRAKLADKYEKCFRKINRIIRASCIEDSFRPFTTLADIHDEIEKVYKS
jgi:hypothetical protein